MWSESNQEVSFQEGNWWEFSRISLAGKARNRGQKSYPVKTVSLTDLLDRYSAPKVVDYLSIDTEGSELDILKTFDFGKYKFRVITCEHNHGPMRDEILSLLISKGYVRQFENVSGNDHWLVHSQLMSDQ